MSEKPALLIVDDEPRFLQSLALILRNDFRVLTAANGLDGVRVFEREPTIPIILLDLDMPVMSGVEALRLIRAISLEVKVLILTGRSSHEGAKQCANLGVQGYLEKPTHVEDLIAALRRQMGMEDHALLKELWGGDFDRRFAALSAMSKRAVAHVDQYWMQKLSVDKLAAEMRVSREHLSRSFSNDSGICLNDYIRRFKIMKSKALLLMNSAPSVREVSAGVGMDDSRYFCRVFREETGFTPTEFRRQSLSR